MVTHNFECRAHGVFEAQVEAGTLPACPRGCSSYFVHLVFTVPPSIGTDRVRNASRLVREAADSQGLSDIDVSPSRPGDSVADRNFKRSGNPVRAQAVDFKTYMSSLTHKSNELTRLGFGHPYDPHEWRERKETGKVTHSGAQGPIQDTPMNQYGVEIQRVKER
jgi:hypothetical protein